MLKELTTRQHDIFYPSCTISLTLVSIDTDLNASILCWVDLRSTPDFTFKLPFIICSKCNVTSPQCMECRSLLLSMFSLVHVTTTDTEELFECANLGKEATTVKLVWSPGNSFSWLTAVVSRSRFCLLEDGDLHLLWNSESADIPGCLWWRVSPLQNEAFDVYVRPSGWQLTSPTTKSETELKFKRKKRTSKSGLVKMYLFQKSREHPYQTPASNPK